MSQSDQMEIDLRYLSEERTRHGRRVLYARWKGRRVRIKSARETPEFVDEYRAALVRLGLIRAPGAAPPPGQTAEAPAALRQDFAAQSFGWLVRRYLAESPEYAGMKPVGRLRRRTVLEAMLPTIGHKPMVIPRQKISEGLTLRAEKPGSANNWLKCVKSLYTWAEKVGIVKESPARGLSKLDQHDQGFHTWSIEEIAAYCTRHPRGTSARLALILLLFTGLRRSDAVAFGRQHIRDGVIRFKTSKTGAELVADTPWPLDEALADRPATTELAILLNGHGRAFASGAAFGNWLADRCREAGLPQCSAHGLRKAGATIAAENGASEVELDAMYGWSNQRQSGAYTRAARNRLLANAGFERIATALVRAGVLEQRTPKIVAP